MNLKKLLAYDKLEKLEDSEEVRKIVEEESKTSESKSKTILRRLDLIFVPSSLIREQRSYDQKGYYEIVKELGIMSEQKISEIRRSLYSIYTLFEAGRLGIYAYFLYRAFSWEPHKLIKFTVREIFKYLLEKGSNIFGFHDNLDRAKVQLPKIPF